MARKRFIFFYPIQPFLSLSSSGRHWLIQSLLALLTALLCLVMPMATAVNSTTPSPLNAVQTQNLVQQGTSLYAAGKFAAAVKVFQAAAAAFKATGNRLSEATALSNISLACQQLGQWSQAEQAITQSLNLLQAMRIGTSTEQAQILAQALDIQGRLHLARGQAEAALNTWQQAGDAYTQIGDLSGVTRSRINSAQALQSLGLYRQAQKMLTETNQILQKEADSALKATGLRSLGHVLRVVGDLKQSRQVLQQSLEVAKLWSQLNVPPSPQSLQAISDTWLSLGNTALAQQDTPAALHYYQQAVAASTSDSTRIQAQLNQLRLLLDVEQSSAAQALSSEIQAQIFNLPLSRRSIYAQINFAQSLIELKQTNAASNLSWVEVGQILATAVQQAKSIKDTRAEAYALGHLAGIYEQTGQLNSAQELTGQALILAQSIDASDISYRWQWQLGRLLKAQGNLKEAIAAYNQSVKTLQLLRNDLVAINPEVQFSFREQVEPIYRQLVDLLLQSEPGLSPSQQNLVQAREVIESLRLAELDNFFRVACLQGRPIQIDQVVDRDDPTAAVIYPIILAERLEVILKLPEQPLQYYKTTIAQGEVERLLEDLQQKLLKPYTLRETQLLSKQVYDWLLQPAEIDLAKSQVKTLVFVLDGSLRNIPMAALYDGQHYLVQKYGIALTSGLQLLEPKSLSRRQLKALTAGLTEARQGFSALTNVELELEQIKSQVNSKILINQQFTNTTLQNEINSSTFPIVHLATHGQFSSNAEETFILTWDGRIDINQLNNLLRVRDQGKANAIELLVLSACQTAAGDKRAALGLAGVAVRAGARSTIASLWNLDDESTALLMSQFYRELGNKQLNKAEALRQAQLSLLNNPEYQSPLFWAPYVLVGSWL